MDEILIIALFIIYCIWREIQFIKTEKDLLNRIMSKNYDNYIVSTQTDIKIPKKKGPSPEEEYENELTKKHGENIEV